MTFSAPSLVLGFMMGALVTMAAAEAKQRWPKEWDEMTYRLFGTSSGWRDRPVVR